MSGRTVHNVGSRNLRRLLDAGESEVRWPIYQLLYREGERQGQQWEAVREPKEGKQVERNWEGHAVSFYVMENASSCLNIQVGIRELARFMFPIFKGCVIEAVFILHSRIVSTCIAHFGRHGFQSILCF